MRFRTRSFVAALGGALLVAVIGFSREAATQETSGGQAPPGLDEELSGISGDPGKPRRSYPCTMRKAERASEQVEAMRRSKQVPTP